MIDQEGIKIDSKLIDRQSHIYLVNLGGYVDQTNVHLLQNSIDESLNESRYKLIFDLKNLAYMSSAGWGVLIGEIKRFRENGGDIKLINMGAEVFEIYQMLEFYHIIAEYPSLDEAREGFSSNRELRLLNDASGNKYDLESEENEETEENGAFINNENNQNNKNSELQENPSNPGRPDNGQRDTIEKEIEFEFDKNSDEEFDKFESKKSNVGYVEFNPLSMEKKIDPAMLPLPEKVRKIIGQFPQLGFFEIKKALKHPDYGEVKIGYFKLRTLLKELDLDTKEKRMRYYKSI